MLISSIVRSLLASGVCGHACPRGLWSDFCLCVLCVREQFVMWHVYVWSACVYMQQPPSLSPTSTRRVRRSRPLKDSSRQPQYRLPKYICSWESSSICLSLPLFPSSSCALSSLGVRGSVFEFASRRPVYILRTLDTRVQPQLRYLLSNQWESCVLYYSH